MRARIAAAALAAGFATALLMGCGIDTRTAGTPNPLAATTTAATTTGTTSTISAAARRLPKRPALNEADYPLPEVKLITNVTKSARQAYSAKVRHRPSLIGTNCRIKKSGAS